ncbi:MAG: hypothetical protein IPG76_22975 [Acidobacteria bacterium]|nr:hypothetical protein [Acidobacteriota bacterium]
MHWRGQPAKRLRGFLIDAESPPSAGTELFAADGKKVGEITSSIHSISLDRPIALELCASLLSRTRHGIHA